jgi:ABC-2 type transport system ATP-binding protein
VCDRVLIINKGHIVAEDSPRHLQARLTGSQRVTMQIRGECEEVMPIVSAVQGVTQVVARSADTLEFESMPGQDTRPHVARAVIAAGYDLLQLQPVNLSLEEIFLQLTREDAAVVPTAGEEE